VIGGLICAAEIARDHQSLELADFLEQFADWIESHLEDWTVTNDGVLLPEGVKRHYMRIRPPETGDAIDREGPAPSISISTTGRPVRATNLKPARSSTAAFWSWCATAFAAPTTR
jgi:glucoamylase